MAWIIRVNSILLGEGLYCKVPIVIQTFDLVDSCESSLAQFLHRLVEQMEAKLIEAAGEVFNPNLNHASSCYNQFHRTYFGPLKYKPNFFAENRIFTVCSCLFIFIQQGKLELVIDFSVVISWIFRGWITDECKISVGKNNFYPLCEISIEIEVALKAKLIAMNRFHDILVHWLEYLPHGVVISLVHFSSELAEQHKII